MKVNNFIHSTSNMNAVSTNTHIAMKYIKHFFDSRESLLANLDVKNNIVQHIPNKIRARMNPKIWEVWTKAKHISSRAIKADTP